MTRPTRPSRRLIGVVLILLVGLPGLVWADTKNAEIIAHLEFLGYQCDAVEQGIRARHSSKIHLLLSHAEGGLLVQTGFPGKRDFTAEGTRYTVLNTVNARARTARAFWTDEGHLLVSAWMPGGYEKLRFAAFMEAWEQDMQVLREFSMNLKPYLSQ
ncbi:MAG: hypothetical protein ICV76_02770 [Nitrospiraceae bacterium]|jgi:hypothetical protein|nr:hypothetical protein [Nitrospiraceae bacterium]